MSKNPANLFPNSFKVTTITGLLQYLRPYPLSIVGAFLALLMTAVSILMLGKGMGFLVEQGIGQHNSHLLNKGLIAVGAIILLLAIGSFLRSYLVASLSENAMAALKRDL